MIRSGLLRPWTLRLAVGALGGALLGAGGAAEDPPCESDALGEISCAEDPRGSAVVDPLGRVLCAPGMCVEIEDEWLCSTKPGGSAGITPDGPVCDGECRPPTADACVKH